MAKRKGACPGCGARFYNEDGPTHAYMTSSPACWRAYGELLAAEYSSEDLMLIHRLTVDAYAVQHPGGNGRRAIQSVGLHLAGLKFQLVDAVTPEVARKAMQKLSQHKASLVRLEPPRFFSMTITDVAPLAGSDEHVGAVTAWAKSAWEDWRLHHAFIEDWIETCYDTA